MVIHADSSYLIDLRREQAKGKSGRASIFLEAHAADALVASVFVVCELDAGAALAASPDREQARLRALFQVLLVTLHRAKKTVDAMDLLIATSAVVDDACW